MVSVSAITSGISTAFKYGKRLLKVAPELAFGTSSDKMAKVMKGTNGSVFQKTQAGWHELERASQGNFFKKFLRNCKNFFPDIPDAARAGIKHAADKAAKSGKTAGIFTKGKGALKGVFHKFGKKMPFIMSVLMILTEAPNVIKATKEQGIFQGAKEILKFGARMTTAGLFSAIGTVAIPIPFVGSLIGWSAGEWLASKIVGKSYTEQQEEKQQIISQAAEQPQQQTQTAQSPAAQQQQNNPYGFNPGQIAFSGTTNPYNLYQMQNLPYANDMMMRQMPFNIVA